MSSSKKLYLEILEMHNTFWCFWKGLWSIWRQDYEFSMLWKKVQLVFYEIATRKFVLKESRFGEIKTVLFDK